MIQILRGTNAQRVAYAGLEPGRFIWCTDTKRLWVGSAAGDKQIALTADIDFVDLGDTFAAYAGREDKILRVNAVPDGIVAKGHPGTVGCRVYLIASQANIGAGAVKVLFDAADYDIGSDFDLVNSKWVAPVDGYYWTDCCLYMGGLNNGQRYYVKINKNAALIYNEAKQPGGGSNQSFGCRTVLHLTAADELEAYEDGGDGATDVIGGDSRSTWWSIHLLSED